MSDTLSARASAPQSVAVERPPSINEGSIHRLVHGFYGAIREDELLGPIFHREIAPERWPEHLDKMCAFWSSVLLRTGRYNGQPLPPHLALADISDEHFERWLGLFRHATEAAFDETGAAAVIALAERIAHSFRLGIAFHRGEDTMRPRFRTNAV